MKSNAGLLLDTHIWVDFLLGNERLQPSVRNRIEQARQENLVYVSVISTWEVAFLARRGRIHLPFGTLHWIEQAMLLPGTQLLPLTPAIAVRSVELPQDLNRDPADRILVATAEVERLQLVTRDRDVIRFAKPFPIAVLNARKKDHAKP